MLNDVKVSVISKDKLLCLNDRYQVFSKGCLLTVKDSNNSDDVKLVLPVGKIKVALSTRSLIRRLLRLDPRCACFVNDSEFIVSFSGAVYRVNIDNCTVVKEHEFVSGMNNPLDFCLVDNVVGIADGVYYGDYIGQGISSGVNIYHRDINGCWSKVFTFEPGRIKHVHNVIASTNRNCLYVLTGDSDSETGIWEVKDNFNSVRLICGGNQKFRSCVAFEWNDGLIYATDAPQNQNYLYYLDFPKNELVEIRSINGSCIYGCKLNEKLFAFSTTVEQDEDIVGWKRFITRQYAKGLNDTKSHIYIGNPDNGFSDVYSCKKDFHQMSLFGFGNFMFPNGLNNQLLATGYALNNLSGQTISIKYDF